MNKYSRHSFAFLTILVVAMISFSSCNENPSRSQNPPIAKVDTVVKQDTVVAPIPKSTISYSLVNRKSFFKENEDSVSDKMLTILSDINRVDIVHLKRLDSILVPTPINLGRFDYSPFPEFLTSVQQVDKILFFAYYEEYFGAYENGKLVLTGPTNMGKGSTRTPTGLFFTNWKAKESVSTVSDEWILKWNFNISNFGGIGFHEYSLPGYPASHSCLRLKPDDAMFFYSWANQWKLGSDKIIAKGTPVIVYGMYPFGKPKPWLALATDSTVLSIPVQRLDSIVGIHLETILKEQANRRSLENTAISQ